MAKILRPRRGKYSYAVDQSLVLAKGEMFLSYSDNNYSSTATGLMPTTNNLYIGDGSTPIASLPPFITNEYSMNSFVKILQSSDGPNKLITSSITALNGGVRTLNQAEYITINYDGNSNDMVFDGLNDRVTKIENGSVAVLDNNYLTSLSPDNLSIMDYNDNILVQIDQDDIVLTNKWARNTTSLKTAISDNSIVNLIYPVGSIYLSANNTNPGTLFNGTTWELLPGNYALKTITSGTGASTASASNTGSTTLTAAQSGLPAHNHTASGGAVTNAAAFNTNNSSTFNTGSGGAHKHTYNRTYNGTAYKLTAGTGTTVYHSNADAETSESTSHSHVVPAHAHTVPAHGHGFTQPTISNATTQNASAGHTHTAGMPQNISVYAWKRTN